jgi:hypothetical protein
MNGLFLTKEWNNFAIFPGLNNEHIKLITILREIFPSQLEDLVLKRQSSLTRVFSQERSILHVCAKRIALPPDSVLV